MEVNGCRVYDEAEYDNPEGQKKGLLHKVDKWNVFKQVACMAASGCATAVVSRYLKANVPAADSVFEKAVIGVGTYFVTGVVGAKVAEYCEDELDQLKDAMAFRKEITDGREG